jgi:hypothetical protein
MQPSAIERLRLRRRAAELVASAMEAPNQGERESLLAEACSLTDGIERENGLSDRAVIDDPIEPSGASGKVIELRRQVQDTQVFLRMAVIELRRMAKAAPDIAVELRHLAQKLEAQADDLARGDTTGERLVDPPHQGHITPATPIAVELRPHSRTEGQCFTLLK